MAELAVSFALVQLRDKLEQGLDRSADEEAMKIDKSIEEMKGFLNNADWRREKEPEVKEWVGKARALAYSVEDAVDGDWTRDNRVPELLRLILYYCIYFPFSLLPIPYPFSFILSILPVITMLLRSSVILYRRRFRRHLKKISEEIEVVLDQMKTHNFELTIKTDAGHAATSPLASTGIMVGRETHAELVRKQLLERNDDRGVVFITGAMGTGKTTLAASVTDDTKNHFDCHAWAFVSQPLQKKIVWKEILDGFYESCSEPAPSNLNDMGEQELSKAISSYLKEKKYLLVLDGVRDLQTWNELTQPLLLQFHHGGKIMVTTTNAELPNTLATAGAATATATATAAEDMVGPSSSVSNIHKATEPIVLTQLSDGDSKTLLRSKAVPGRENSFPPDLEDIEEEILSKCQGLPISIVTVGSLLSTKEAKPEEWEKVLLQLDNLSKLTTKDVFVSSGYADLTPDLKQCFLYCGIFPENHKISKKRLIRMWVAEGFIEKSLTKTREMKAEELLEQLIKRNMIQVAKRGLNGEIQSCRMLHLMSDFAQTISKEDNFCMVRRSTNDDQELEWKELRRLSTMDDATIRNSKLRDAHNLRSLLFFGANANQPSSSLTQNQTTSEAMSSLLLIPILNMRLFLHIPYKLRLYIFYFIPRLYSLMQSVPLTFKMLRVLELEGLRIKILPNEVCHLILLRYFGLRRTGIVALPKFLTRLIELETLDIRQTNVQTLPDLYCFRKLRHLYMEGSFMDRVVNLSTGVMWLTQLQSLTGVTTTDYLCKQLGYLSGLRKLSLGKVQEKYSEDLCESISQLTLLQSLSIKCDWGEKLNLQDLERFHHFPDLIKLKLGGRMDSSLNWVSGLHSLCYLYMWDSQLINDPLTKLKHLNKLVFLSLYNAYEGDQMSCDKDSFPSLKKLSIICLRKLKSVNIEEGAMPNLEHLFFAQCPEIEEPPAGIHHLKKFKTMQVTAMPSGFEEKALEKSTQGKGFRVQVIRQIISDSA